MLPLILTTSRDMVPTLACRMRAHPARSDQRGIYRLLRKSGRTVFAANLLHTLRD